MPPPHTNHGLLEAKIGSYGFNSSAICDEYRRTYEQRRYLECICTFTAAFALVVGALASSGKHNWPKGLLTDQLMDHMNIAVAIVAQSRRQSKSSVTG